MRFDTIDETNKTLAQAAAIHETRYAAEAYTSSPLFRKAGGFIWLGVTNRDGSTNWAEYMSTKTTLSADELNAKCERLARKATEEEGGISLGKALALAEKRKKDAAAIAEMVKTKRAKTLTAEQKEKAINPPDVVKRPKPKKEVKVKRISKAKQEAVAKPTPKFYLLITGSREAASTEAGRKEMVRYLEMVRERYPNLKLIHGGAKGADQFSANWARAHGLDIWCKLPDWNKFGKRAGIIRNEQMVNALIKKLDEGHKVGCLAFPTQSSVGTRHCIKYATEKGISVKTVEL